MKNNSTQISAATALVQLLQENPELPTASWRVDRDGLLSGTVAIHADYDMRDMVRAYAAVLGGAVHEQRFTSPGGQPSVSAQLYATWRDVQVNVWGTCLLSALTEQVAA